MKKINPTLASWLVVMSAASFFFFSFIQMTLFSTQEMKAFFMESLNLHDQAAFGVFAGMFLNACVIFLIPVGILLDKFSVKKMIIAGLILALIGTAGLSFAKTAGAGMFFRFLTGMAHCVAFMAPLRRAPRWFPSSKLALVTGLMITFAVSGGLVSQTPMLMLVKGFGGETSMLINLFLGGIILVLVLLFTKDYPSDYTGNKFSNQGKVAFLSTFVSVIKNTQNWFSGLYIGLLNLAVLLLGAIWGTNYLMHKNPLLSGEIITSVIGMIFIGTMIGSPLCGWLSDKLRNRKSIMIIAASVSLLIMVVIMLVPEIPVFMLYFLFLFLGIITAAQTIGYPVIAESNEEKNIGTANGFGAVLIMGMAAIAQPLFGSLIRTFGGETTGSYMKAIWLMPVSFGLALLCAILLKETFKK